MSEDLFERNLRFLARRHPHLADRLAGKPDRERASYTEIPRPNLLFRGRFMHSRREPIRESERSIADLAVRPDTLLLIFGLGLGYQIDSLRNRYGRDFGGASVIVVEKSREIFRALAEHRDLAQLLENVTLLLDEEPSAIIAHVDRLNPYRFSGHRLIRLRGDYELYRRYYDDVEHRFNSLMTAKLSDVLTRFAFESLWMKNFIDNVPLLTGFRSVESLRGALAGKPVLVVGAGPSLREQLPRIREASRYLYIVSVDTSADPLLLSGVCPDFIVSLDAQFNNLYDFALIFENRYGPVNAILIADLVTCPAILKRWPGKVCFSETGLEAPGYEERHPFIGLLKERAGVGCTLRCGGSVATTAVDFARLTGAGPVLIAGLDLAYTDYMTHVASSPPHRHARTGASRLDTLPTRTIRAIAGRKIRPLPGNDGGEVTSDFVFENYIRWFARGSGDLPPLVNVTSRGAALPGVVRENLEEVLKRLDRAPKKAPAADLSPPLSPEMARLFLESLGEEVAGARESLQTAEPLTGLQENFPWISTAVEAALTLFKGDEGARGHVRQLLCFLEGRIDRSVSRVTGERGRGAEEE